jgi:outer membrane lipoprotein-sorting protein
MHKLLGSALLAGVLIMNAAGPAQAMDTNIRSYICQKLDDFTATITVVRYDQRELAKINKDLVYIYKFKEINASYKEPNKLRMDGKTVDGFRGVFIINGPMQYFAAPKLGLKTTRNFGESPGKRKSLMDVGLVSDYYLTYTNARFMREGTADGVPCAVFDMTYKDRDADTSHHVVYIDPKTKVVLKREAYSQTGKLQAVYHYKDVKEVAPGIWFPTLIEAENVDRVIAGVTAYKNVRVNVGLQDTLFKL